MSGLPAVFVRVLAAAVVAVPLVGAPATATHPVVTSAFFADHSRACDYAYTEGKIAWNPAHWGETQRVDIAGVLVDEPVICAPPDPPIGSPLAEFTAYIAGNEVDSEVVSGPRLGDASGQFRFSLFNTTGLPDQPIDQVDVRVCRTFGPMLPAFSCGETETYRPPRLGPAD